MFKNVFRSSACLLVVMLGASLAQAQIRSATIAGTVTDSAGAVVPNANVVVTEQATNVNTPTKSTAAGEFTVPYLPAGTYTVSVNVTGFQPFVVKDLVIATTQTVRVTASLTLSGVQQTVRRIGEDAEVARVYPHRFRHTYAHAWLANGGTEGDLMRQVLAGILKTMRDFTLWYAPNVNSYKRYQPGSFAPTALRSHTYAARARDSGRLAKEIHPVEIPATRKQPARLFEHDESIRADTTNGVTIKT